MLSVEFLHVQDKERCCFKDSDGKIITPNYFVPREIIPNYDHYTPKGIEYQLNKAIVKTLSAVVEADIVFDKVVVTFNDRQSIFESSLFSITVVPEEFKVFIQK